MDLVTNYVVIPDTIKFVQQSQAWLKATKEGRDDELILSPSDKEEHNKKQRNMITMTKMVTGMKTRKKGLNRTNKYLQLQQIIFLRIIEITFCMR
jgi:hypothetical protein